MFGGHIAQQIRDIRVVPASQTKKSNSRRVVNSNRYNRSFLVWLDDTSQGDQRTVGSKAAHLGELDDIGIPVPPGFAITSSVFDYFLRTNRIDRFIERQLAEVDYDNTKQLHDCAAKIQAVIARGTIDARVKEQILDAYQELRLHRDGAMQVAVRPSIPPLERTDAHHIGDNTTLLNIAGNQRLLDAILEVWASVFTARAIYYRNLHGVAPKQTQAAILIQRMVEADVAGVLTTADPTTGNRTKIIVEAAWGLGQAVVRGLLTPDHYVIDKESGKVLERDIATQPWKLGRDRLSKQTKHIPVAGDAQSLPKLDDDQLGQLATLGSTIEDHFQFPQNTEWAIAKGQIFFVQAGPMPRIARKIPVNIDKQDTLSHRPALLEGDGATVGVATGPVKIIHSQDDLAQVRDGDVVVTELASPDFLPAMKKAAALVTDTGGRTSHAALLSHEFGIPVVVGTGNATHIVHEGQTVTVDGTHGRVYRGAVDSSQTNSNLQSRNSKHRRVRTATKLMVNLAAPDKATEIAKLNVDGVGLLRAEFMIASLGEHPKAMIADGRETEYVRALADGLEQFARAFHPHPVVYRASDFKSNEYRALKGGQAYEQHEENPMLGFRGTARYLADPALLRAELTALKEVRTMRGYDNVQLMLPFVRTVEELRKVKELVAAAGLTAERTFKLRMMAEVPSNVLLINEFLDEGIDGISIGSNDLTQLILGIDRDSAQLNSEFNEMDPAVRKAVAAIVYACKKRHVPVSVCGQAASTYPEFAEFLIQQGVTTLSVDPSSIDTVRDLIISVEYHLD